MRETTGGKRSIEELEDSVLGALDLYFEAVLTEVSGTPRRLGPAVESYEEARRELAEAEEKLERIRLRTRELNASTVDALAQGNNASELGNEISELQGELRDLIQEEKTAQRRKEVAEESLRQAERNFEGDLGLTADQVAALALRKAEEIDAFKTRVDQRFAEGRTSVLEAAV